MLNFLKRQGCFLIIVLVCAIGILVGKAWLAILAGLILLAMIKNVYTNYIYHRKTQRWVGKNEGALILFYANSKKRQKFIEENLNPHLPEHCLKVYLDGPALVGDIPRHVVIELMHRSSWQVHHPVIAKIHQKKLICEDLYLEIQTDGPVGMKKAGWLTMCLAKVKLLETV